MQLCAYIKGSVPLNSKQLQGKKRAAEFVSFSSHAKFKLRKPFWNGTVA